MKTMLAKVDDYNEKNGVVLPEASYNPLRQLLFNNWQVLLGQLGGVIALTMMLLGVLVYGLVRLWRRLR